MQIRVTLQKVFLKCLFTPIKTSSASQKQNMEHTIILSAFASEIPLIASRFFFGAKATDSIVKKPASSNFFTSDALIPCDYNEKQYNYLN